jgi:hypothetical protein
MAERVFEYVKQYRARLDNPNILQGNNLRNLAQRFWRDTSTEGTALEGPIEGLGDGPLGVRFMMLWRANYGARQLGPGDGMEEKQFALDEVKREADAFLFLRDIDNKRGIIAMRGVSKEGLSTLPPELQREVVGFLSPGGRSESAATAISRMMVEKGGPGVRSDLGGRGPPPPPPGGAGPAAAGAGGPAGGKRRKTRKGKGKSRRARYSRRR